ncbi:MAG: hypothetical protein H8E27_08205 [Verrucomicrobia subdivision 3 bacterium]|nr:hypothetical protein [Limisphaerales bacterium]
MKQLIAIFAAALVGGAATFVITSGNDTPARADHENFAIHDEKLAELRRENQALKARRNIPEIIEIEAPPVTPEAPITDATFYLDKLKELKPDDGRTKRRAVHYFESLVDLDDTALPPIGEFLAASQDLEFLMPAEPRPEPRNEDEARRRKWREGEAGRYFRPFPKPDNSFPPTLRLGLLETIAHIGGNSAETLLLKVLEKTLRGVEVAYLEIALQEIAPDQYLDRILAVTRAILANPPAVAEDAGELDRRTKGYLYSILVKHNDRIFVDTAKGLLITEDGSLDGYALSYLRQVLGVDAMPILLAAYKDPRITNEFHKAALRDAALRFIGTSAEADAIFHESVKEGLAKVKKGDMFDFKRYEHIAQPLGALMRDVHEQPVHVITARRKLLGDVRKQSSDILLQFGFSAMDKRLGEEQKRRQSGDPK